MTRAVLRAGAIVPLDPLPPEWEEGAELIVKPAKSQEALAEEADRIYAELEEAVKQIDPKSHEQLEAALQVADRQAKAQVRREMGLP